MRFTMLQFSVSGWHSPPRRRWRSAAAAGHRAVTSAAGGVSGVGGASSTATGSTAVASTSEPLALFAVGLGLLGARFLRRR